MDYFRHLGRGGCSSSSSAAFSSAAAEAATTKRESAATMRQDSPISDIDDTAPGDGAKGDITIDAGIRAVLEAAKLANATTAATAVAATAAFAEQQAPTLPSSFIQQPDVVEETESLVKAEQSGAVGVRGGGAQGGRNDDEEDDVMMVDEALGEQKEKPQKQQQQQQQQQGAEEAEMDELEDDDVGDSAVCEKDGPRSVREQHPSPEPVSQSPGNESADTTLATTTTTAIPSPAPIHPHARTTHPDARAIISINIRDANNYDTYFHCRPDTKLAKLLHAYADRYDVDISKMRFVSEHGVQLPKADRTATVRSAGLADGDEIDVMLEQIGGAGARA
ncbi:hypothetical protein EX895_000395 [Sporisorium graminicola]|uniref:Ubiquitin-like domain-containing protein n=1 Tax=Sporisorium graminicola TaxID=280036 RepID=A0A4U7L132_9BASI|nr:hypothetical protein EX895_000395 [Sporisorium graminicola]TKY90397.1 hypothetical protein EX895_000395 [Sporisorium graminicola]